MRRLQAYDSVVNYKPEKYLYTADTLSRCPLSNNVLPELDEEVGLHCNFVRSFMEIPFSNIDVIREHVNKDHIFSRIKDYIQNGWPKSVGQVDSEVMPY